MRRAAQPCTECPWRRDQPLGRFSPTRFSELRDTCAEPGGTGSAPPNAPLFACHKTTEGREIACAGWLAVEGVNHVGVRLAVLHDRLDPDALAPDPHWPALYDSYEGRWPPPTAPPRHPHEGPNHRTPQELRPT